MNSLPFSNAKLPEPIDGIGLLFLRLWAGQEFFLAGWAKLSAGWVAPAWFAGLAFPWPISLLGADLNWLLAGVGEMALATVLLLGIGSRLAAAGLIYITYVAIYSVHFDLGWAGWNQIESDAGQGFKVPLMLALMLLTIVSQGGGTYSVDAQWRAWRRRLQAQ